MMKERPHYLGHRARLRDRMLKDPKQLADYELLELLLGGVLPRRDTKPLAKAILARFGTLRGAFTAHPAELRAIEGFGPALGAFWVLLAECRARFDEAPLQERAVLSSPKAVADLAMSRFGGSRCEEFWLALVDNRNRLMAWERLTLGTVDQAAVYPREVLTLALERKASGIVMVHNHPGGDPTPSKQDVEHTRYIMRVAKELGMRVLDHVIVVEDRYYSFQAQGML